MREIELLIVGGGPAGQAAALAAAACGIETMLVDERPVSSAWMSRQVPLWYGDRLPDSDLDEARHRTLDARPRLREAGQAGVDVRIGTSCWAFFEDSTVGLFDGTVAELIRPQQIILATGSMDIPLPFPGRTLPGVLGGLGALDLLATRGTLGGSRVVVLGAGVLGIEVARRARVAGHTVVALADIAPEPTGDPAALAELEAAGVEVIPGYTVAYATGDQQLEQVMLVGVDAAGDRLPGESYPVRADTLVVAIGRAPSIELPYLAGCDLTFDSAAGGYLPVHTATMATSVPRIYVAGDAAGASDAAFDDAAIAERQGQRAALAAARALGKSVASDDDGVANHCAPDSTPFTRWLHAAQRIATDDVVICRCEGITRRDLIAAVAVVGDVVPDELKRVTRAGMGQCQGRGCRLLTVGLLAERHGVTLADIPLASYRPPVRPIPLGALAAIETPEDELLPVFAALEQQLAADADAGLIAPGQHAAAHYKVREENHLALEHGLSETESEAIARALRVTVRHVTVH